MFSAEQLALIKEKQQAKREAELRAVQVPKQVLFLHGNGNNATIAEMQSLAVTEALGAKADHLRDEWVSNPQGTNFTNFSRTPENRPTLSSPRSSLLQLMCPRNGYYQLSKEDIQTSAGIDPELREMGLAGDFDLFNWYPTRVSDGQNLAVDYSQAKAVRGYAKC